MIVSSTFRHSLSGSARLSPVGFFLLMKKRCHFQCFTRSSLACCKLAKSTRAVVKNSSKGWIQASALYPWMSPLVSRSRQVQASLSQTRQYRTSWVNWLDWSWHLDCEAFFLWVGTSGRTLETKLCEVLHLNEFSSSSPILSNSSSSMPVIYSLYIYFQKCKFYSPSVRPWGFGVLGFWG